MTLVFITNLIHHHQIPLADEFYRILGNGYTYITTKEMPEFLIKGGYADKSEKPYLLRANESEEKMKQALALIDTADVVIVGASHENIVKNRIRNNKLTFNYSERWFKKRLWHYLRPGNIYHIIADHLRFFNKKSYMLCASAYARRDANLVGCYINKCFRWGYFTKVEEIDIDMILKSKPTRTHLMWCARFLDWKHPELPVLLAYNLKKKGYDFKLNMFGSGEMMDKTKELAKDLDVLDVLEFKGNLQNDRILEEMRSHHIFLFTSDRYEGWGAVLNESMSNGCAVIASNEIGAAPYLIENGKNGLIFKSKDIDSLISKTEQLLNDKESRERLARNAYITLKEKWSPIVAARNFLMVAEAILKNRFNNELIVEGPCSLDK